MKNIKKYLVFTSCWIASCSGLGKSNILEETQSPIKDLDVNPCDSDRMKQLVNVVNNKYDISFNQKSNFIEKNQTQTFEKSKNDGLSDKEGAKKKLMNFLIPLENLKKLTQINLIKLRTILRI